MRLLVSLSSRWDAAYQNDYHDALRSVVYESIRDSKYEQYHNDGEPVPFTFSNPFPPGDMEEGDSKTVIFASPYEGLLAHVAANLEQGQELNIKQMPFTVESWKPLVVDVGEPGTTGTIKTATGIFIRIPHWKFDEYGIEPDEDSNAAKYWRPHHSMEPFLTQLEQNLDRKHNLYCPDYLPGPSETDGELFSSYEFHDTYAVPIRPGGNTEREIVVSEWTFEYTVRDDHHRRHLNLALDVGLGERNALGFGFSNITEKNGKHPAKSQSQNDTVPTKPVGVANANP